MERKYSELKSIRVKSSPLRSKELPKSPTIDLRGKPCGVGQTKERDGCIPNSSSEQPQQTQQVQQPVASQPTTKPMTSGSGVSAAQDGKLQFDPNKVKEQPKPSEQDVLEKGRKIPELSEKLQPTLSVDDAIKRYKAGDKLSTGDKLMLLDAAASGRTVVNEKNYAIGISKFISEMSQDDKEEAFPYLAQKLKDTGNNDLYGKISGNVKIAKADRMLWADTLEEVSQNEPLKTVMYRKKMQVDSRDKFSTERMKSWDVTKNHDIFLIGFADDWASSGDGANSQLACNPIVSTIMPQNEGKDFWSGYLDEDKANKIFALERLQDHFAKLKNATGQFYKDKLNEPLKVKRGVGFKGDTYLPSPSESWTTDDGTVAEFAGEGGGVILEAEVTYNDVLFSYESFKDNIGWPPEGALIGEKEYVILGGALKNIEQTEVKRKVRFR